MSGNARVVPSATSSADGGDTVSGDSNSSSLPPDMSISKTFDALQYAPHQITVNDKVLREARKYSTLVQMNNTLGPEGDMYDYLGHLHSIEERNNIIGSAKAVGSRVLENVNNFFYPELDTDDVMFAFDEQLHEAASKFYANTAFLHHYVLKGSLALLQSKLAEWDPVKRAMEVSRPDPVGATPIHIAYQNEEYEIGQWLVRQYPDVALLPHFDVGCGFQIFREGELKESSASTQKDDAKGDPGSDISSPVLFSVPDTEVNMVSDTEPIVPDYAVYFDAMFSKVCEFHSRKTEAKNAPQKAFSMHSRDEYNKDCKEKGDKGENVMSSIMPFTGQNILHMAIVNRRPDQVLFLLEFFREHEDAFPGGLIKLLTERATGRFFRFEGNFYFGETALFFACCSNHRITFNTVLQYACTVTNDMVASFILNIKRCLDPNDPTLVETRYLRDTMERTAWFTPEDLKQIAEGAGQSIDEVLKKEEDIKNGNGGSGGGSRISERNKFVIPTKYHFFKGELMSQFGHDTISQRNRYGHTLLHMCVRHDLTAMYGHVWEKAKILIEREVASAEVKKSTYLKPITSTEGEGSFRRTKLPANTTSSPIDETIHYIELEKNESWRGWSYCNERSVVLRRVLCNRFKKGEGLKISKVRNATVLRTYRTVDEKRSDDAEEKLAGIQRRQSTGDIVANNFGFFSGNIASLIGKTKGWFSFLSFGPGKHMDSQSMSAHNTCANDVMASPDLIYGLENENENIEGLDMTLKDLVYYMNRRDFVEVHSDSNPMWCRDAAKVLLDGRLHKALSEGLHTPMTLAAARKSVEMLEYIIDIIKVPRMTYGPISRSLIDLEGLEIPFEHYYFRNRNWPKDLRMGHHRMKEIGFNSTIAWLCRTDQEDDDGREDLVGDLAKIYVIREIIQGKWTRTFAHKFALSKVHSWCLAFACTVLLLFTDAVPKVIGRKISDQLQFKGGSGISVLLYLFVMILLLRKIFRQIPLVYDQGLRYFFPPAQSGARGVVIVGRWLLTSFFILFGTLVILRVHFSVTESQPGDREQDIGILAMALTVVNSYLYLFFFYMGDESTGPFLLVVYKIIQRDLPNFMRYYLVFLFAFACAISVLTRDQILCDGVGDDEDKFKDCEMAFNLYPDSLWHFGDTAVALIKQSLAGEVGGSEETNLGLTLSVVYDFVQIFYSALVVLMLLNLFIAMVTYTYDEYQEKSGALLLLEKYNMMDDEEHLMKMYDKWITALDSNKFYTHTGLKHVFKFILEMVYGERFDSRDFVSGMREQYAIQANGVTLFEVQETLQDWWQGHKMNESMKIEEEDNNATLLIIDPQNDFHEAGDDRSNDGSLVVKGSVKDASKTVRLIEGRNKDYKTFHNIVVTLDSHYINDIGHPPFWLMGEGHPDFETKCEEDGCNNTVTHSKDSNTAAMCSCEVHAKEGYYQRAIRSIDKLGRHPAPFTPISHNDVKTKSWGPRNPKLRGWCIYYTKKLEGDLSDDMAPKVQKKTKLDQKFVCMIWPQHCIIGSTGFAVFSKIQEALREWSAKNQRTVKYVMKGTTKLTEMYSALKAEVPVPSKEEDLLKAFGIVGKETAAYRELGTREEFLSKLIKEGYLSEEDDIDATHFNHNLFGELSLASQVVICGQALSHCVNYTTRDLMRHWTRDPSRIVIIEDAASNVSNCDEYGERFLSDMAKDGATIIKTDEFLDDGSTPIIQSLTPNSWSYATRCRTEGGVADNRLQGLIKGKNFRLGDCKVLFEDLNCELIELSPTSIVFEIPTRDCTKQLMGAYGTVGVKVVCGTNPSELIDFSYED